MANKLKPLLTCSCVLLAVVCAAALVYLGIATFVGAGRCRSSSFKHAAVAADSEICSEIGKKMLQRGGSAVDGAIAALLCTSVVNPQSMGIGGGSILVIRNKTGDVKVYNFRECVPKSIKPNLLKDCPTTFTLSTGSKWIGVPGELRGYEAVHKQYGKLPWSELFQPTIKLAREGFPIPPYLAYFMSIPLVKIYVENSSLCEIFCKKDGTVLAEGDTLRFSKLAETLQTVAQLGADAFYSGKIGHDLIQDVKAAGGTLTIEDLKSFEVHVDRPWVVSLGNLQLHIPPPPAGGALLAFILQIMRGFSLSSDSLHGDKKMQLYHLYIEAAKFANGQRGSIHDPLFNNSFPSAEHLIDPSFADKIRKLIVSDRTHDNSYYNITPSSDRFGTTHVSVLDEDGLAVSATSTINQIFGGGVYSSQTGVILNNELVDFCWRTNTLRAGEQPPSSMAPVILESKSGEILVIGGSGGSMITSAVALSLINHLWLGMSLTDAIAAPIIYVDSNNNVNFEKGFDEFVIKGLKALGHKVGKWEFFVNVVNALEKKNGCIEVVSDRRKRGKPAGY
ncbi:glutathione hydrolase 5 proenzyme isoform X1 [Nothobranchius furzeri]|uniref:Glutathione hydrolase n=1 Tax=Nothobranchius furzeri TaxID=105023 RepID=A0A1A8UTK1_NOTFU|nr:gamma-glutamyltransferase 5-like [Nothobranchius furzeri]